jgi:hypothetical protein
MFGAQDYQGESGGGISEAEKRLRAATAAIAAKHACLVNALFVIVYLLAGYAMGEHYLHTHPIPSSIADLIFVQAADIWVHRPSESPKLLLELTPNSSMVHPGPPRRTITVNSLGLRDPERTVAKPPGVFRVIMLGTSTAYGAEVSDGELMTGYMEKRLNENAPPGRRYEVWNAGISSYVPVQMCALGRKLIGMGCDPDVVIFQNYLLGPRAFLNGHIDERMFARDPTLFSEHLTMPWSIPESLGAFLAGHSRSMFYAIGYFNAYQKKHHLRERLEIITKVQAEHHREAMERFAEEYKGRFKMAAFQFACQSENDFGDLLMIVRSTGMPLWCLRPEKSDPEYQVNHPPGYVYDSYARELNELLRSNDFLPAP